MDSTKFYARWEDRFEEIPAHCTPKAVVIKGYERLDLIMHTRMEPSGPKWRITEGTTGLRVSVGDTQREARDNAVARLGRESDLDAALAAEQERYGLTPRWGGSTHACYVPDPLTALAMKGRNQQQTYGAEFLRIFGVSLGKYWHPLAGFDVVGFDAHLAVPEGESLRAVVRARYGEHAERVIEALLA
jgi:hypothetical protein